MVVDCRGRGRDRAVLTAQRDRRCRRLARGDHRRRDAATLGTPARLALRPQRRRRGAPDRSAGDTTIGAWPRPRPVAVPARAATAVPARKATAGPWREETA